MSSYSKNLLQFGSLSLFFFLVWFIVSTSYCFVTTHLQQSEFKMDSPLRIFRMSLFLGPSSVFSIRKSVWTNFPQVKLMRDFNVWLHKDNLILIESNVIYSDLMEDGKPGASVLAGIPFAPSIESYINIGNVNCARISVLSVQN